MLHAERASIVLLRGGGDFNAVGVTMLASALWRAGRSAPQVFRAASRWLADKAALVEFSDQDLGRFAVGFNEYIFDVDTQVRLEVLILMVP